MVIPGILIVHDIITWMRDNGSSLHASMYDTIMYYPVVYYRSAPGWNGANPAAMDNCRAGWTSDDGMAAMSYRGMYGVPTAAVGHSDMPTAAMPAAVAPSRRPRETRSFRAYQHHPQCQSNGTGLVQHLRKHKAPLNARSVVRSSHTEMLNKCTNRAVQLLKRKGSKMFCPYIRIIRRRSPKK